MKLSFIYCLKKKNHNEYVDSKNCLFVFAHTFPLHLWLYTVLERDDDVNTLVLFQKYIIAVLFDISIPLCVMNVMGKTDWFTYARGIEAVKFGTGCMHFSTNASNYILLGSM